jgi:hypothetical protein
MVDGLNEYGEEDFARGRVRRFYGMYNQSGFAVNFDASTGKLLCDTAYIWKRRAFLMLVFEYLLD